MKYNLLPISCEFTTHIKSEVVLMFEGNCFMVYQFNRRKHNPFKITSCLYIGLFIKFYWIYRSIDQVKMMLPNTIFAGASTLIHIYDTIVPIYQAFYPPLVGHVFFANAIISEF